MYIYRLIYGVIMLVLLQEMIIGMVFDYCNPQLQVHITVPLF